MSRPHREEAVPHVVAEAIAEAEREEAEAVDGGKAMVGHAEEEVTPEDHMGWQQSSEATNPPAATSFLGRAAATHPTAHLELGLAVASSVLGRALDASPAGRISCVLSGANEAWTEVVA